MDTTTSSKKKTRVAILGAGPGGMAAAWGLSATAELRETYEVTIYQPGWRLGGQCSTGREGPTKRIAQNGSHYFFGSYDNTLRLCREAYADLKARGVPGFGTFEEALIPRDLVVSKQFFNGNWTDWMIQMPTNNQAPGTGGELPSLTSVMSMMLQFMIEGLAGWCTLAALQTCGPFEPEQNKPAWWRATIGIVEHDVDKVANYVGEKLLKLALKLLEALLVGSVAIGPALEAIAFLLSEFRRWLWCLMKPLVDHDLAARRIFILLDLGTTGLIGFLRDGVVQNGLSVIDQYEFREWLLKHGARDITAWSPPMKVWYDAVAAYLYGDVEKPIMSAAVASQSLLRLLFTYKGSVAYQMSREIGDTLIAPWYQVMHDRGVQCKYFHRVWDVVPSTDGTFIDEIAVEQQVELIDGPNSYRPFIDVKGYHCWPNAPLWDQIKGGDPGGPPLDSFYRPKSGPIHHLKRGDDFDIVILAMPIQTLPHYCKKILAQRSDWRRMVDKTPAVETQAIRMWWKVGRKGLGWFGPSPILSSYVFPFSTWEDDIQLIETEIWPRGEQPKEITALFGPLPAPVWAPPPEDVDYPARQAEVARKEGLFFLKNYVGAIWPGVTAVNNPVGVDWDKLADYERRVGDKRFEFQEARANCGPVERYTMAPPGTLSVRLRPDQSGYENLFLSGDWTRNGFEIGSFEGAAMAGLRASQAISGFPQQIIGLPVWEGIGDGRSGS